MTEHGDRLSGHVRHYGSGLVCEGCEQPLCVSAAFCSQAGTHLLSDHVSEAEAALLLQLATRDPGQSRLEKYRREIPQGVKDVTQVVVDNPGQFALLLAGSVVIGRAAANIVRPRTALEALALMVVLQVGIPVLAAKAIGQGWIRLRVRDADGCLVPLAVRDDPGADPA